MIGNELRPRGNPSFPGPLAGNSRIAEPYSDLSKLFCRRCRIIRAAVPRARIRHNPGVLHCIITYPLHYCVSGESEPDRAPDSAGPDQDQAGIGRADGRRLNLGLGGMKILSTNCNTGRMLTLYKIRFFYFDRYYYLCTFFKYFYERNS